MEAAHRLQQRWQEDLKRDQERLRLLKETAAYLHQVVMASPGHLEDRPLMEEELQAARQDEERLKQALARRERGLAYLARFQEYRRQFGLDP